MPDEKLDKQAENRNDRGQFVKGTSGNPNGRPRKGDALADMLDAYLEKETVAPGKDAAGRKRQRKLTYRQLFVESQVARAINGDGAAARNVWERIDGRVAIEVEHSAPPEGINFVVTYVKPEPEDD